MFGRWVKCKSCELQLFQYLYFEIKYARSTLEVCLCFLSTFVEYIISFVSKRFTQFSTLYHIIEFILILMKSFSSEQKKMLQNKFKHGWSALQLLDLFMVYERYFNWISIKTRQHPAIQYLWHENTRSISYRLHLHYSKLWLFIIEKKHSLFLWIQFHNNISYPTSSFTHLTWYFQSKF